MKVIQMPPVHEGNLVANSGNTAYGVDVIALRRMPKDPHQWLMINIGSSNGLVPSGKKQLSEPVLTKLYVAVWHPQATMS